MTYKLVTSAIALAFATTGAVAQDNAETFGASAGVALMSPEQTGYMFGATVGVNGVGSAAANVTRSRASHAFSGYADSNNNAENNVMESNTGVLGSFTFERDVTVNGSLVGRGNVVAEGTAQGMSGFMGSATAFGENGLTMSTEGGDESQTSMADSQSEAALSGSASTRANLTLTGSEDRFAAANGTSLGEITQGLSISALGVSANDFGVSVPNFEVGAVASDSYMTDKAKSLFDGSSAGAEYTLATVADGEGAIQPVPLETVYLSSVSETGVPTFVDADGDVVTLAQYQDVLVGFSQASERQQGVFFTVDIEPTSNEIDLSISNAGGGSIGLTAQTGGFFTGGASGFGEFEFGGTEGGFFASADPI
jgi:hypothetical protein